MYQKVVIPGMDPKSRLFNRSCNSCLNSCSRFAVRRHDNTTTGFTLIELLVVVLIIGILAAIALPQYRTAVDRASVQGHIQLLYEIKRAQEMYYFVNGDYTRSLTALDMDWEPYNCVFQGYGQIAICGDAFYVEAVPNKSRWMASFMYCPKHNEDWGTCSKRGNFVIEYTIPFDHSENQGIVCTHHWKEPRGQRLCHALPADRIKS